MPTQKYPHIAQTLLLCLSLTGACSSADLLVYIDDLDTDTNLLIIEFHKKNAVDLKKIKKYPSKNRGTGRQSIVIAQSEVQAMPGDEFSLTVNALDEQGCVYRCGRVRKIWENIPLWGDDATFKLHPLPSEFCGLENDDLEPATYSELGQRNLVSVARAADKDHGLFIAANFARSTLPTEGELLYLQEEHRLLIKMLLPPQKLDTSFDDIYPVLNAVASDEAGNVVAAGDQDTLLMFDAERKRICRRQPHISTSIVWNDAWIGPGKEVWTVGKDTSIQRPVIYSCPDCLAGRNGQSIDMIPTTISSFKRIWGYSAKNLWFGTENDIFYRDNQQFKETPLKTINFTVQRFLGSLTDSRAAQPQWVVGTGCSAVRWVDGMTGFVAEQLPCATPERESEGLTAAWNGTALQWLGGDCGSLFSRAQSASWIEVPNLPWRAGCLERDHASLNVGISLIDGCSADGCCDYIFGDHGLIYTRRGTPECQWHELDWLKSNSSAQ